MLQTIYIYIYILSGHGDVISKTSGRIRSGGGKSERRVGRKAASTAQFAAEAQKMNSRHTPSVITAPANAGNGAGRHAAVQELAPPSAGKGGDDCLAGAVLQSWREEEHRLH